MFRFTRGTIRNVVKKWYKKDWGGIPKKNRMEFKQYYKECKKRIGELKKCF